MYAIPPGHGPRPFQQSEAKPRYTVSNEMKEAIRGELKRVLDGEISSASLQKLLKLARAARAILLTEKPGAQLARHGHHLAYPPHMMDPDGPDEDGPSVMGDAVLGDPYGGGVMAPAPYPETFGTSVIREAIAAIPKLNQKPDKLPDLLEALHMAKESDMTEVAEQIKAKIAERLQQDHAPPPDANRGMCATYTIGTLGTDEPSLSDLAQRAGVDADVIVRLNGGRSLQSFKPGDQVLVPYAIGILIQGMMTDAKLGSEDSGAPPKNGG